MTLNVNVPVENVPDYATTRNYIVCSMDAGRLWFYGAYNDENRALEVANYIEGMAVKVNE